MTGVSCSAPPLLTRLWRPALLCAVAGSIILLVALQAPIPQDPAYHQFADQEQVAAIPNFMNVVSNLPFLAVGCLGLLFIARNPAAIAPETKPAWLVFFLGIALTTFGSGYYHLLPGNGPLVWDRLPMTIGFMSLVAVIAAEYYSLRLGRILLLPLLIVGFASVAYWSYTESLGRGDLRPYAIVQFLPMLLIPLVVVLYRERSDLGRYVGYMVGFYLAAKVAEYYDAQIYSAIHPLSGHALKHVIAALAPASLLVGLMRRRMRD